MAGPSFDAPPCPVCGADDVAYVRRIAPSVEGALEALEIDERPRVDLVRCGSCAHHFARPQIAAAALALYYRELGSEFYASPANVTTRAARTRFIANAIERWAPGGRILDIGCGRGDLLRALDPLRWERVGVEPFQTADLDETAASGVTVFDGLIEDVPLPEGSFDVAVAVDLLEHLHDAHAFAQRLRSLVRDGGFVVAVTGDISSLSARLAHSRWGYFASWEHVSFFTPASVRYLFENAGFTVVENRRISHDQRIKGIHNYLALAAPLAARNLAKRTLNLLHLGHRYKLGRYPLLLDHMLVVARADPANTSHSDTM